MFGNEIPISVFATPWQLSPCEALASNRAHCRGTSLIRNRTPPRTAIEPYAFAYCRVLGGSVFS